jgi:hypothetical protein
LKKLLIQVPAGIVAVWLASRFVDFDFGTIGGIATKIAAITVLGEGVACWIPIPFFSIIADLAVILVGFFILFELSKWQTYLIVLLNFAVLFVAHHLMANYINQSGSYGSRPPARRLANRPVLHPPGSSRSLALTTEGHMLRPPCYSPKTLPDVIRFRSPTTRDRRQAQASSSVPASTRSGAVRPSVYVA